MPQRITSNQGEVTVRINIYEQELDGTVSIVTKTTPEGTFTGVRLHLKSPASLMEIDRESGITFWGLTDLRNRLRLMLAPTQTTDEVQL